MTQIYENASRTLVRLGPTSPGSLIALDIIDRLHHASALCKVGKDGICTNKDLIENGLPGFEEAHQNFWAEVNSFFHHPWFQ